MEDAAGRYAEMREWIEDHTRKERPDARRVKSVMSVNTETWLLVVETAEDLEVYESLVYSDEMDDNFTFFLVTATETEEQKTIAFPMPPEDWPGWDEDYVGTCGS